MKGLQVTIKNGIPDVVLTTLPKPIPKPGSILVRLIAAAINPSDVLNSKGGFSHTVFPRVLGRDFAGLVVGPKSSHLLGREVFGTSGHKLSFTEDGTHAEYVIVGERAVAIKPRNLSFAQAASIGVPFTTAFLALSRTAAKAVDTVMVLGATGAVGSATTQLAKQMGCKVLTVSRKRNSSICLETDPDLSTATELTCGRGPDVVIDTIGDIDLMHCALASLSQGGRLSVMSVGMSSAPEMFINMKSLYRREHILVGCNSVEHSPEEMGDLLGKMAPLFESGELKATKDKDLIKVRIEDALEAYERAGERGGAKYVIYFGEE
ncbi:hypothetical protein MMC08_000665 [Hypocenomyce scalaris]|nr:hypothetical protein [Hypocenomyce scalaris]